ncbi:MAG TPA: flagellar motor protein MotB [Verrucomicrobiae bacterium]
MKAIHLIFSGSVLLSCSLISTGCVESRYTSPYHPGPAVGHAVGTGVGVVAGNAVGIGVGAAEGVVEGAAAPFDPSYHMVRHWATQTTPDGRVIQVPVDILVDKYGRPVAMPPPTGNVPTPSASVPVPPPAAQVR